MLRTTALMASLVAALAVTAPAFAANGHKGGEPSGSSSISLVVLSDAEALSATANAPRYGDWVTFEVDTNETDYPWVNLKCYQDGALVAEGWDGFFEDALGDGVFGLYSGLWTGGAAECTASLKTSARNRWRELASTSFHVDE